MRGFKFTAVLIGLALSMPAVAMAEDADDGQWDMSYVMLVMYAHGCQLLMPEKGAAFTEAFETELERAPPGLAAAADRPEVKSMVERIRAHTEAGSDGNINEAKCSGWLQRASEPERVAEDRFATPHSTWDVFRQAHRDGDLELALECMTPGGQDRYRAVFESLGKEGMDSFAGRAGELMGDGRQIGSSKEFVVVMEASKNAGVVAFREYRGNWLIDGL